MKSLILFLQFFAVVEAFHSSVVIRSSRRAATPIIDQQEHTTIMTLCLDSENGRGEKSPKEINTSTTRRNLLFQSAATAITASSAGLVFGMLSQPSMANAAAEAAAQRKSLGDLLYTILRVREALSQESRLIKSGKFKDVQRANVKLAVKFMVQNYRLADTFIAACTYLEASGTNNRRIEAGQVGQAVVQNLITITEYFDSSDVQNIKVGSMDSMSGKETLVLRGLDSAKKNIDEFLAFFPTSEVDAARARVREENELNAKEFDSSLGTILNLDPNLL